MTRSTERPYPPFALATRVFGLEEWDDPYRAYESLGAQTKAAIVDLLPDDWSFDGKRVLDFGSGAGRTLRQFLLEAEGADFWGTDIHAPSIAWLDENLSPPLHGWTAPGAPPLGLEHGSFDLIWAVSVFTHLADNSTPWLLELHKLLKPGGYLIPTYIGQWNSEFAVGEVWNENRVGRNVVGHNRDWEVGGPAVLISDWWMREHWGRAFEIVDVAPQTQNMTWPLLRKKNVDLTTEDLERPSDDPREYEALRHNLVQVRRDVDQMRLRETVETRQREAAIRAEFEQSLSWRATAPLRGAARAIRRFRSPRR